MSLPAICHWASGGERLAACCQLTGNEITRQALQQIASGWLRQADLDRVQSKVAHLLHARCGCGRTGMLPGGTTRKSRRNPLTSLEMDSQTAYSAATSFRGGVKTTGARSAAFSDASRLSSATDP
jgi:hypothetical protein